MGRGFKATLMCNPYVSCATLLPTILIGLGMAFKEDLQASPAKIFFGTALRVPEELIAIPALTHHCSSKAVGLVQAYGNVVSPFIYKSKQSCSHLFKGVDAMKIPHYIHDHTKCCIKSVSEFSLSRSKDKYAYAKSR